MPTTVNQQPTGDTSPRIFVFTPHPSDRTGPSNGISWKWISLTGPDAQDFLHRVTTVNTRDLPEGAGAPGCFLTAQGKIRAFFRLWNYGPGEYGFELESGENGRWEKSFLEAVDQYTFAEKMALTPITGLECRWIFGDETLIRLAPELKPGRTMAIEEEIRICHHGSIDFGRPWLTAWGRPARLNQWIERVLGNAAVVEENTLESWRIRALRPRVDREITDAVMPLEIGLTDAIAPNKGCYPGQEVIEKVISLGSPPRRLAQLEGIGQPPAPGSPVSNLAEPSAEVGQVTSVSAEGGRFIALGWVKKIHAKEGLEVKFTGTSHSGRITRIAPYA